MEKSLKLTSYLFGFLVLITAITSLYHYQYSDNISAKDDYESVTVAQLKKDLECLALNIYREGAYEPIEGRIAIAQVTMNRVLSKDFPNTVCGVVYQKNRVVTKTVCQFSWYCDASHRNRPINQKAYDESYEVAKKVLLEGFRLDSLTDALYYHADYVNPRWKLERINQIGTHIFYKPKGTDHPKLAGADI
jgi:spore germination cell wall hydrolase CwlJ-like protein